MKSKRILFILTTVFGALYGAIIITSAILFGIGVLDGQPFWSIFVLVMLTIAAGLFMRFITRYLSQRTLYDSLRLENLYTLGQRSSFYNLYAFQTRVAAKRLGIQYIKQPQHIIAFTSAVHGSSAAYGRSSEQNDLNSRTATELNRIFSSKKIKMSRRNNVFCFDRGVFLIYNFGMNNQEIKDLIVTIRDAIYEISQNHVYHIQVQPFFGIVEAKPTESLLSQIDNATLTRDYAERNFESFAYYTPNMRKEVSYNQIEEITAAFEAGEFVVYYQPKFSLNKKEFISSEALIRWNSPKYGLLGPAKFMEKIEAAGLVHEVDTYVFRAVCADLSEAKRRGRRVLPVSINFSLFEFYAMDFLSFVMDTIHFYEIDPSLIEIEITETTSQANQFLSLSTIRKLKENGLRVLMDDFGIGYSNIGNLRKIPFDAIKIDKSYIDDIVEDAKAREIVKTLITMGKTVGLEVIAEGVDSQEKIDILRRAKCDTIQGFYYAPALSKEKYDALLRENPFEGGKKK